MYYHINYFFLFFFFFKQKTAYEMRISDWSSDVCSSDLIGQLAPALAAADHAAHDDQRVGLPGEPGADLRLERRGEIAAAHAQDAAGRFVPFADAALRVQQVGAERRGAPIDGDDGPGRGYVHRKSSM